MYTLPARDTWTGLGGVSKIPGRMWGKTPKFTKYVMYVLCNTMCNFEKRAALSLSVVHKRALLHCCLDYYYIPNLKSTQQFMLLV